MARYWNEGYSQDFILLQDRIWRRQILEKDDVSEFCRSFPYRAKKVWKLISSPYLKKFDDSDFIVDDDEEITHVGPHPIIFDRPDYTVEEEVIQSLKSKRMAMDSSDDGGEIQNEKEELVFASEDEMITLQSSSSEDEWTKKKLSRQSPNQRKQKESSESEADQILNDQNLPPVGSNATILEITDNNGHDMTKQHNLEDIATPKKRRTIIIDSDDE